MRFVSSIFKHHSPKTQADRSNQAIRHKSIPVNHTRKEKQDTKIKHDDADWNCRRNAQDVTLIRGREYGLIMRRNHGKIEKHAHKKSGKLNNHNKSTWHLWLWKPQLQLVPHKCRDTNWTVTGACSVSSVLFGFSFFFTVSGQLKSANWALSVSIFTPRWQNWLLNCDGHSVNTIQSAPLCTTMLRAVGTWQHFSVV